MSDGQQWATAYEQAWQDADPEAAGALFTPDATYQVTPFEPPMQGRDEIEAYWRRVTSEQDERDISCTVLGSGPDEHLVHFHAKFVAGGAPVTLDGVLAVTLDGRGACTRLREWWHAGDGD